MKLDINFSEEALHIDVGFEEKGQDFDVGMGDLTVISPVIVPLAAVKNGTYTAPDGVDGFSPVTVDVPKDAGKSMSVAVGIYGVTCSAVSAKLPIITINSTSEVAE